jgi:hypothetical protein
MSHFPIKVTSVALFCVAYLVAEFTVWVTLVPHTVSPATFMWSSVLGLLLTATAVWATAGAQATRSIAHVLHDVEEAGASAGSGRGKGSR